MHGPPAPPGPGSSTTNTGDNSSCSRRRSLSFQLVELPDPLLGVLLSKDLAKALQLTPLKLPPAEDAAPEAPAAAAASKPAAEAGVFVSAARVRALLSHQAGVWRLEPLPGGTRPEAVAAALELHLQGDEGLLAVGSVELTALLGDLQVIEIISGRVGPWLRPRHSSQSSVTHCSISECVLCMAGMQAEAAQIAIALRYWRHECLREREEGREGFCAESSAALVD